MIYISSSCSKKKDIRESVMDLVDVGFKNIELSGGTEYYDSIKKDIEELKNKYQLNFLLHNYFPPPKKHFVLNLASENEEIGRMSLNHIKNAINWSRKLNAEKYGFHAGFFMDPKANELGKSINYKRIFDKNKGIDIFIKNYSQLDLLNDSVKLYIENNVLSMKNFENFGGNPFMLTHFDDFKKLRERMEFNLLLDVAHLKVSCQSLGLNFHEQLQNLLSETDYLHLSDNDGFNDSNLDINSKSELFELLKSCRLRNKTVTLEIYTGLDKVVKTFELINPLVS